MMFIRAPRFNRVTAFVARVVPIFVLLCVAFPALADQGCTDVGDAYDPVRSIDVVYLKKVDLYEDHNLTVILRQIGAAELKQAKVDCVVGKTAYRVVFDSGVSWLKKQDVYLVKRTNGGRRSGCDESRSVGGSLGSGNKCKR